MNLWDILFLVFYSIVLPFVSSVYICSFCQATLGLRYNKKLTIGLYFLEQALVTFLLTTFVPVQEFGGAVFIGFLLNLMLLVFLLFNGSLMEKAAFTMIIGAAECVAAYLVYPVHAALSFFLVVIEPEGGLTEQILGAVAAAAECALVFVVLREIPRRCGSLRAGMPMDFSVKLLLPCLFVTISLASYYNGAVWMTFETAQDEQQMVFLHLLNLVALFVFSLLGLFAMLVCVYQVNQTYCDTLMQQQQSLQAHYFEEVRRQFRRSVSLQHDIKSHLLCAFKMLEKKDLTLAKDYLNSIFDTVETMSFPIQTGNEAADAVMNSKGKAAIARKIDFICNAKLPEKSVVDNLDLCFLLGNGVDNAIEACNRIERQDIKKFIRVRTGMNKAYLLLEITNSAQLNLMTGDYPTQTEGTDGGFLGIGIETMRQVVEKYGGRLDISADGDLFTLSMILPFR